MEFLTLCNLSFIGWAVLMRICPVKQCLRVEFLYNLVLVCLYDFQMIICVCVCLSKAFSSMFDGCPYVDLGKFFSYRLNLINRWNQSWLIPDNQLLLIRRTINIFCSLELNWHLDRKQNTKNYIFIISILIFYIHLF